MRFVDACSVCGSELGHEEGCVHHRPVREGGGRAVDGGPLTVDQEDITAELLRAQAGVLRLVGEQLTAAAEGLETRASEHELAAKSRARSSREKRD